MWEVIPLIIWGIAGVITLAMKEVSKFSYGICWFCLMFSLIIDCME